MIGVNQNHSVITTVEDLRGVAQINVQARGEPPDAHPSSPMNSMYSGSNRIIGTDRFEP